MGHGKTEPRLPRAAAEQLQGREGCTEESSHFLMKHLMKSNSIHFQEESAEQNTLWNVTFLSIAGQDRTSQSFAERPEETRALFTASY